MNRLLAWLKLKRPAAQAQPGEPGRISFYYPDPRTGRRHVIAHNWRIDSFYLSAVVLGETRPTWFAIEFVTSPDYALAKALHLHPKATPSTRAAFAEGRLRDGNRLP